MGGRLVSTRENAIGIDAEDFRRAAHALEREGFQRQAGRTTAYGLRRSANAIRRQVRARARTHRRTGRMAGHVRTRFYGSGLHFQAKVYAGGSVAGLVVRGTKPHAISSPKAMPITSGKALVGFARAVEHPGTQGDPFFAKGVRAAAGEVNAILSGSADTMTRELKYRMERR